MVFILYYSDLTLSFCSPQASSSKPLSIADEMKQRMLRRQAAISGKQDQLEQKRDRERFAKQVPVLTAKEVTAPTTAAQPPPPPPPPPASESDRRKRLPSVEMSDDGSVDDHGDDSDMDKASNEDEVRQLSVVFFIKYCALLGSNGFSLCHLFSIVQNDFLAQIRNIKKKQDAEGNKPGGAPQRPAPPPPKAEEPKAPLMAFETVRHHTVDELSLAIVSFLT